MSRREKEVSEMKKDTVKAAVERLFNRPLPKDEGERRKESLRRNEDADKILVKHSAY